MSVNQILVICLIAVLVAFVAVLAYMSVHAVSLMKSVKELTSASKDLVGGARQTVTQVGDKMTSTALDLVDNQDTFSKVVGGIALGVVGIGVCSALYRKMIGANSRKAAKAVKKSEKELRIARNASRKAKKIQKKAKKLAKKGL